MTEGLFLGGVLVCCSLAARYEDVVSYGNAGGRCGWRKCIVNHGDVVFRMTLCHFDVTGDVAEMSMR